MNTLLLTLAQNIWAIEPKFALTYMSELEKLLPNAKFEKLPEPVESINIATQKTEIIPYFIEYDRTGKAFLSFDKAEKGSVALISLRGVMTKHDQYCGPVGAETIGSRIQIADNHENIAATILAIESGGGSVQAINPIIDALSTCKKPIAIFIDDFAASAALMISPFADFIMARHEMAQIGSLGVMGVYQNDDKKIEAQGITLHSYYSKYSISKNKNEIEALQGNGELVLNKIIDPICRKLLSQYATQRGSKLRDDFATFMANIDAGNLDRIKPENIFTGEMFFAHECLPGTGNGLIDSIGSIGQCAEQLLQLSKSQIKFSTK
jgi:ClpP class serine protease